MILGIISSGFKDKKDLAKCCMMFYILIVIAGWSSSVARRAHNPKAQGSNPCPATRIKSSPYGEIHKGFFF